MALGRWTSRVLQVLGFAGLLVSIALAIAILLGRTWVAVAVGDVFTTADTTIANGLASVDEARSRLTTGAGTLEQLVTDVGRLPATATIPAAVAARVSQAVESYAPARDRYVEARSQAQAALRYLETASRVVPGVQIPSGLSTALAGADERLVRLDSALTALRGAARATAGDVAAAATTLRDAVTAAADSASNLRTQVEDLRVRLTEVHSGVDGVIWLGTGALLAVVGYVALLNAIIVWLARRRPKAAPAVAIEPGPVEPDPGP
jgi:hypothetical protein